MPGEPLRQDEVGRLAGFSRLILFDKRGTGLSDRAVPTPLLLFSATHAERTESLVLHGGTARSVEAPDPDSIDWLGRYR